MRNHACMRRIMPNYQMGKGTQHLMSNVLGKECQLTQVPTTECFCVNYR